jgi:hypothetical protein
VARTREGRNMYRVLVGSPTEKDHLEDQGVGGRMGSQWALGRLAGGRGCGVDSPGRDRDCRRALENVLMNLRVLAPCSLVTWPKKILLR